MCRVLIIEDEGPKITTYKDFSKGSGLTFLSPPEIGLGKFDATDKESVEEQLAKFLRDQIATHGIDLVLLDTDLSRDRKLQTHSSYKSALRELGMPVCRYQKGGTASSLEQLPQLQRTIRDGASAIWIPKAVVSGDRTDELVPRLVSISQGFKDIEAALQAQPQLLEGRHSPTEVLAAVLGDQNLSDEFLGYAAQNLVYFAKPEVDHEGYQISEVQRYATQLGYWLFNYIITFPGPILRKDAALAYLNIHPDELAQNPELLQIIAPAQYSGPFGEVEGYYWRFQLIHILDECGGDVGNHPILAGKPVRRIDPDNLGALAFVCMVSGKPITAEQAAVSPDWVPSGASEAKIDETVLEELGPLAGI
ncbi:hypothetical protein [Pseudomonas gingeri]|uniref:Uncharacterized protein n=1 Tax=Pseudomonas gingeri TaxID=117681 RepID=A0A7Y8BIQ1_9PSED|nr:hypothetical protein [Pseudomonas gingeri]NWB44863.1 hypothetical protein [Pseudomonas gingeri]